MLSDEELAHLVEPRGWIVRGGARRACKKRLRWSGTASCLHPGNWAWSSPSPTAGRWKVAIGLPRMS